MGRVIAAAYGVICYVIFFPTLLYAIGFVGNFYVPKSIDSGVEGPLVMSLIINAGLLGLFAVQHSVMARPAFKEQWTKLVPKSVERSTYVLITSLILIGLFYYWQPLTMAIWQVQNETLATGLVVLSLLGWGILVFSTFTFNHFELFGLQQIWLNLQKREAAEITFKKKHLYNFVRHPMMVGFIIAFWATPSMTLGHLLFAVMTTCYILVALLIEEHDLENALGEDYSQYKKEVPMIIPGTKRKA